MNRVGFFSTAVAGVLAMERSSMTIADAASSTALPRNAHHAPIRQIRAGVLEVGYYELGPSDGKAVFLLHGFPYSIGSYNEVAPILAARGCRVIVPYLRGHGSTRFLNADTPRSGEQAALGADLIALMDALRLKRAVVAGYDWGGRAACVAAALWPDRCEGLVSVNSYLIQDIAAAGKPVAPSVESGIWYQFYFLTERGRAGLRANRAEIARTIWQRNSPTWHFDDEELNRHAAAFDNSDYVDVVIHSYRHRLGTVNGYAEYADIQQRLAALPTISVPTITLDGRADGVVPATDGKSSAKKFTGNRTHRIIDGAGHNLPQEAPAAFADAVWDLAARNG